jgi:hypothetical protein
MYLNDRKLSEWNAGKCLMSTCDSGGGYIAWESQGTVNVSDLAATKVSGLGTKNPKHPRLAVSRKDILVTWTENTGWHKGGALHWQLLDHNFKLGGPADSGHVDDLPAWGYPAAFATPGGSFIILY